MDRRKSKKCQQCPHIYLWRHTVMLGILRRSIAFVVQVSLPARSLIFSSRVRSTIVRDTLMRASGILTNGQAVGSVKIDEAGLAERDWTFARGSDYVFRLYTCGLADSIIVFSPWGNCYLLTRASTISPRRFAMTGITSLTMIALWQEDWADRTSFIWQSLIFFTEHEISITQSLALNSTSPAR